MTVTGLSVTAAIKMMGTACALTTVACLLLLGCASAQRTNVPIRGSEEELSIDDLQLALQNFKADPDVKRNIFELAKTEGFEMELHTVETDDGFLLGVHRIPRPIDCTGEKVRPPVILQHGILDSSETWVLNDRDESLAFILSDAGYDVWMPNSRGNTYSRQHKTLKPSDKAFWAWSWDEMADFDVPANVDYVRNFTGYDRIPVIAHSQGGSQYIAALLSNPELSAKINMFTGLAPVTYISHTQSGLLWFISELGMDKVVSFLGFHEFLPSSKVLKTLLPTVCSISHTLCDSVIYLIAGIDLPNLNQTRLPVYTAHFPHGCSVQDISHYAQMIRSGKFQKYDFGKKGNKAKYGQDTPPQYNVSKWPKATKLVVYIGDKDDLADPVDANKFMDQLPDDIDLNYVEIPTYAHLDFTWGMHARAKVYDPIVESLKAL